MSSPGAVERAHEAWKKRWGDERAPRTHFTVKLDCDIGAFCEAIEVVRSSSLRNQSAAFDPRRNPACVIEFDATWEAWEAVSEALQSVPARGKWVHQDARGGGGAWAGGTAASG